MQQGYLALRVLSVFFFQVSSIVQLLCAEPPKSTITRQEFGQMLRVASAAPVYLRFAQGFEVDYTSIVRQGGRETTLSGKELLHGECWKQITINSQSATEPKKYFVRNASYTFQVSDVEEGKYLLTGVTAGVKHPRFSSVFCWPYADRWMARTLLDIVMDPRTVVHRLVDTEVIGKPAYEVAVSFQYCSHSDESKTETYEQRYFFLKENFLLVASCSGVGQSPLSQNNHILIEYSDNFDAIRRIQEVKFAEQIVRLKIDFDVTSFRPLTQFDPTEFRLTHFGIPEPIGEGSVGRGGISRYLTWGVFPVLVVVAIYVAIRSRKNRSSV